MASTAPDTRTRLLDITRLASRVGRQPTGIDRVELAYFERFLSDDVPAYFLVGTSIGFLLLDRAGGEAFLAAIRSGTWPNPSIFSRLFRKQSDVQRAALTLLRSRKVDAAPRRLVADMLARHFGSELDYYNVGHTDYRERLFAAIKNLGGRTHVMIHDVIPLAYPEYTPPERVTQFTSKMRLASRFADRVICVSQTEAKTVADALKGFGRVPNVVHAHIGVAVLHGPEVALPPQVDPSRPYFMTVGTIEPRKNHALLLDLWEQLPVTGPQLLVVGSRGWMNESVFKRLDAGVRNVVELSGLSDNALYTLLKHSRGLLCPSFAEGFGLPPVEAAALGVPVFCGDLPVFQEVLGNAAVYLPSSSYYSWQKALFDAAEGAENVVQRTEFVPPNWDDHFKIVLK